MSNWGTMWQEGLLRAGRPSTDATRLQLCIVDAIDAHKGEGFFFNETSFSVATVDGQSGYGEATAGFPKGLVQIIGDAWLDIAQDTSNPYELERVSWPTLQQWRESTPGKAQPERWSWWNKKLEVHPTPDATIHNLRAHCYAAPGSLVKKYTGGAFVVYKPDGTTPIVDAYPDAGAGETNAWFGDGYLMILCFALHLFYGQHIHAQDGRDSTALQNYLQAKGALEQRAARLSTPRFIEPMILNENEW